MRQPVRVPPGPGQESVWDFPRPPRLERSAKRLRVVFAGKTVADTTAGWRVLETSHPPVYYLPQHDMLPGVLVPAGGSSFCEYKGRAGYFDLVVDGERSERAGWSYPLPSPAFAAIANHVAFYASRVDACYVDDELVVAQPGDFYGGWVTRDVVGPIKGSPGTSGW
ncbi:MAG: DUF427 domain-containing protein [Candidatus Eremiobacteraeota bacterium]|nr:DUF427 domain-containing protein [Candidatus Eremiobacteraeota bacterium]